MPQISKEQRAILDDGYYVEIGLSDAIVFPNNVPDALILAIDEQQDKVFTGEVDMAYVIIRIGKDRNAKR